MSIVKVNIALSNSLKDVKVCFNCFKAINRNSETGRSLELDFNGGYKKYKNNGNLASQHSLATTIRLEKGHIQLKIGKKTILLERLIAICYDITQNKMPLSYEDLVANVMDGSGSVFTACKLGIPVNYHPNNIEWCNSTQNGVHGSMIMEMQEKTGHVYRFSANDMILRQIFLIQKQKFLFQLSNTVADGTGIKKNPPLFKAEVFLIVRYNGILPLYKTLIADI